MSCFQVDRGRASVVEGGLPARDANAPAIAGFESRKAPLGHRRDEIVSIEHGEIEKLFRDLDADRVKTEIFRARATISIAIKSGHRIAATATQFGPENIRRHGEIVAHADLRKSSAR